MARKHEAEELLRSGKTPSEIAEDMGVSIRTVIPYLLIRVGEGGLLMSDIYYAFPQIARKQFELILDRSKGNGNLDRACREAEVDSDACIVYKLARDAVAAEMYCLLRKVEIGYHNLVRSTLETQYREDDDQWWVEGVSLSIRQSCQTRREEDPQRLEPYAYTTLINIKDIIDKKWGVFKDVLRLEKRDALGRFDRLNQIRNTVMHPIKMLQPPTKQDFDFVREIAQEFPAP